MWENCWLDPNCYAVSDRIVRFRLKGRKNSSSTVDQPTRTMRGKVRFAVH